MVKNMKLGKPSKWLYEYVFAVFKILLFVLSTLYFFMLIWDSLESVMWIVLEWCIPLTGGFLFIFTISIHNPYMQPAIVPHSSPAVYFYSYQVTI